MLHRSATKRAADSTVRDKHHSIDDAPLTISNQLHPANALADQPCTRTVQPQFTGSAVSVHCSYGEQLRETDRHI